MLNSYLMVKAQEDIADYVRRIRSEKNFSLTRVVANAAAAGLKISNGYISQIENRYHLNPSKDKLEALAAGIKVRPEDLFAIARGKSLEPMSPHDFASALEAMGVEQFQVRGGAENLSADDRREIIAMIEALIEQKLKNKRKGK